MSARAFRWVYAAVLCAAAPQSAPAGSDPFSSEARLKSLSLAVEALAPRLRAEPERARDAAAAVAEMGRIADDLARQAAVHAIRAEEGLRLDLEKLGMDAAALEARLGERAEALGAALVYLAGRVRASSDPADAARELDRGLRLARGEWDVATREAAASLVSLAELREEATAAHMEKKRLARRVADDARARMLRAEEALVPVDAPLAREVAALRAACDARVGITFERGRLAHERALARLGEALRARGAGLAEAQERLGGELEGIVATVGTPAFEDRVRRFFAESSAALASLAARNREALDSRAAALVALYDAAEPASRARALSSEERARQLRERASDRDALRETGSEIDRLRAQLDALRRRAAVD